MTFWLAEGQRKILTADTLAFPRPNPYKPHTLFPITFMTHSNSPSEAVGLAAFKELPKQPARPDFSPQYDAATTHEELQLLIARSVGLEQASQREHIAR